MVGDNHQVAYLEVGIDASGSVGNEKSPYTEQVHYAYAHCHHFHRVPFIVVETALHGKNAFAAEIAAYELAFVTDSRAYREARNVRVTDADFVFYAVCKRTESAAQHYSHLRGSPRDESSHVIRGCLVSVVFDHLGLVICFLPQAAVVSPRRSSRS